jgi:hypothetical protein
MQGLRAPPGARARGSCWTVAVVVHEDFAPRIQNPKLPWGLGPIHCICSGEFFSTRGAHRTYARTTDAHDLSQRSAVRCWSQSRLHARLGVHVSAGGRSFMRWQPRAWLLLLMAASLMAAAATRLGPARGRRSHHEDEFFHDASHVHVHARVLYTCQHMYCYWHRVGVGFLAGQVLLPFYSDPSKGQLFLHRFRDGHFYHSLFTRTIASARCAR